MEQTLLIRPAGPDDINSIGFLAQQIWPSAYGSILSMPQLDYMLGLIFSPESLLRQMLDEKHNFLLVEENEEPIGFASWSPLAEKGVFKLHKLYLLGGRQGKGLGKTMLQFVLDDILEKGATTLRLNVNRHNKARQFYEKMGFAVIKEEDIDIGSGYWMNDYVMELAVPAAG